MMQVAKAKVYHISENGNNITDFIIKSNPHVDQFGEVIHNSLVMVKNAENWFILYRFDNFTSYDTVVDMNSYIWRAVWRKYRKLSREH